MHKPTFEESLATSGYLMLDPSQRQKIPPEFIAVLREAAQRRAPYTQQELEARVESLLNEPQSKHAHTCPSAQPRRNKVSDMIKRFFGKAD